jgi:O-antigen ligase
LTIEILMLLFSLVCILSMLAKGFKPVNTLFPAPWNVFVNGYLFAFLAFLFAKNQVTTEQDVRFVLGTLYAMGLYLAVVAFFEFFELRQFVYPQFINNPKILLHLDRARGPFLNSAFNGIALIVGFLAGFHLMSCLQGPGRVFHQGLLVLFFPAIFFTQTRSIYLGFIITLAALLLCYRTPIPKWKVMALPVALMLVLVLVNVPRLASKERREGGVLQVDEVLVRATLLERSVVMFSDHPLTGVGLGQFIPVFYNEYRGRVATLENTADQAQHNHLIGMLVELGVFGVGLYLAIITMLFRRLYQLLPRMPSRGLVSVNLLLVIGVVLVVQLVANQFVEPSYCMFVNVVFFLFGGMADGLYSRLGAAE